MTITKPTSDAEFPADGGAPHELVSDLVMRLTETDFPARPDELLAALIRARTKAKVLQLLHGIPRDLRFTDLDEFRGYVTRLANTQPEQDGQDGQVRPDAPPQATPEMAPDMAPADEATWRLELAQLLGQQCFPARVDDLISDLALAHAPSRLRWRLARAQRGLRFASLDSLIAHLDAQRDGAAPSIPREPF